jgi:hypothetical protein
MYLPVARLEDRICSYHHNVYDDIGSCGARDLTVAQLSRVARQDTHLVAA